MREELTRRERIRLLASGEFALPKFRPLLEPLTFKGAYGGRASAKSYFFADMHIKRALDNKGHRALCLRQVQKSLRESLKFLIEQRIQFWGVGSEFGIYESKIETPGGGEFVFHGLEGQTAESIKSFEGFDVADIEEGQTIRQRPLDLLIPTIIRKPGAEMWFRWNPRFDTDAVDKFWRSGALPPNSALVECGWQDNPYLAPEIRRQIEADYEADPEKAAHIWGGGYEIVTEGSYFARDMVEAERSGRIGAHPYDPSLPVITSWDIGVDDYTAIWFFQENGKQVRAIDYYETSGDGAQMIVQDALNSKPYRYSKHYFPHDVTVREWGAGAKSRVQTLRELGVSPIMVGVAQGPEERINAARRILPIVSFDAQKTELGRKRLRNYRRRWSEPLQTFQGPLHDDNSHGADAFGEFAVNCLIRPATPEPPKKPRDKYNRDDDEEESSWLTA